MRFLTRYGSALLVGAACTLGACSKQDAATDSATVATATPTPDSAAMAMTPPEASGAGLSAANMMSLIGLDNTAEVGAGKVAVDKATNADVKAFAKMMVADHEAMQKAGDSLATAKGVAPAPPPQASQKQQDADKTMATLNSTPKGMDFDKAYIDAQVMGHQQVLNELQGFSSTAPDPDLKALIDGAIPKVQAHLDRAQQLQAKLNGAH